MSFFNRSKSAQLNKRTGTSSLFKIGRNTKAELPSAASDSKTVVDSKTTPSYAFVSEQRGEVDDRKEERGIEDEERRKKAGKAPEDSEGPTPALKPKTNHVKDNEPDTQASTSKNVGDTSIYDRYWKHEDDYDLEEVVYSDTSYWTPNAIGMFAILSSSYKFARDNRFMIKHHPEYLDYAVACYYSILFYIQILRAQEAAGKLRGPEVSFMNRFRKRFKLEELPVSSILEPYFATIVATLIPDSQYGWIVPRVAEEIFQATIATAFVPKEGSYLMQPMVPFMLGFLRLAISTNNIVDAHQDDYFDEEDNYIPIPINNAAATPIYGNDIQVDHGHARNTILSGCGVRYPFYTGSAALALAAPKWRRTSFRDFPYSARVPQGAELARNRTSKGQNITNGHAKAINALDAFLCMEKTADVDWFEELINQAALHARFFKGVTNLSKIPTTSGFEPTITARMYDVINNAAAADRDSTLGLDQDATADEDHLRWYPNIFRDFRAGFATSRAGVSKEEVMQAFSFATNAEFSIVTNNHRLGGNSDNFRTGEFWANQVWKSEFRNGLGINAKHMFKNWAIMYQEDAAVIRPENY
jgi:hypothetical protein